ELSGEAPAGSRALELRGRGCGPELAGGVHPHDLGRARDRGPAHALKEGALLDSLGADPDRPGLTGNALVRDVDVVGAAGQVPAGARAERDVRVAGPVLGERLVAGGRVVVAGRVRELRLEAGGDVEAARCVAADRV